MDHGLAAGEKRFKRVACICKVVLRVSSLACPKLYIYNSKKLQRHFRKEQFLFRQTDHEHVISLQVQEILKSSPWCRSFAQVKQARIELQLCHTFRDYSSVIQEHLVKKGWYLCLEPGRIVLNEQQPLNCLHLVLSGKGKDYNYYTSGPVSLKVGVIMHSDSTIIERLIEPGTSFGGAKVEETASVTYFAREKTELFVISKSDYIDLSLRQAKLSYQETKHLGFCQTITTLKYWPLGELEPSNCCVQSYRFNEVIVKDSKKSDWVYVIMSGSCRVVKRFVDSNTSDVISRHHSVPKVVSAQPIQVHNHKTADNEHEQSTVSKWKHSVCSPQATAATKPVLPVKKQFLVQLQLVQPKDTFGLSTLIYENEPSVTLVSNDVQCVKISKDFILRYMNDGIKHSLKKQIVKFPSQEAMLKRIKEHHTWNIIHKQNTHKSK